ncbi:MAG: MGMT family protein [archaeon]
MVFSEKVYRITRQIPEGKVSTYGEIAKALNTKGYRAVGQALHVNPYAPMVPCHRVVKTDASLGGFAGGVNKKIKMLKKEGVKTRNNNVVDFEKVLFKKFKKF